MKSCFLRRGTDVTPRTTGIANTAGIVVAGLIAALSLVRPLAAQAQQTVNYTNMGNFTGGTLTSGGITVTSPQNINLTQSNGVGVGASPAVNYYDFIDNGETALFTFTGGSVTDVTVRPLNFVFFSGVVTPTTLEAFGSGGGSLGIFTFYSTDGNDFFTDPSLSARVNNAPISSFRITGGSGTGVSVGSITFTPPAVVPPSTAAPEPGSLALLLPVVGVAGMALRKRSRK